jgi:diguanylate cyclase (GGDEF)-like protein
MERAEQLLQQGRRTKTKIAFVFMDLNGFKPVNDTHGHKAGDVVLRVIADRLQDTIRQTDILARFGGDEFVMGLSDLKAGIHASLSVRRLMKAVVQPIDIEKLQVSVSGSFGVAIYPDDSKDIKTLIRYADEAMYRAKFLGRNRVVRLD